MAHSLVLGMTESGKTTLSKAFARDFQREGIDVIVLDPLNDPGWKLEFPEEDEEKYGRLYQYVDRDEFLEKVKGSTSCMVFVDEAGESVGQFEKESHWLATRSRHYGHCAFFIAQRGAQVAKTVRDQCSRMYLFTSSRSDGKIHADEWNQDELFNCHLLKQGEFYVVSRYQTLRRGKLNKDGKLDYLQ